LFECQTYEEKFSLTQEAAFSRSSIIDNVSYEVCLGLAKGDCFFGTVTVKFSLKEAPSKSIGLDFVGLKIASLHINGTLVENKEGAAQ